MAAPAFHHDLSDDDEPPALVAVADSAETPDSNPLMDLDELNVGPKVPITIVTGYLGAGSETNTFRQLRKRAIHL